MPAPELDAKAERGLAVIGGMMGPKFADGLRESATSGGFASAVAMMAINYAFADCWGREGLTKAERSLVTIGMLIAAHQPLELKNHVKIGLANGLTVKQIEEALIHATPYVGFPAIATALTATIEALREAGHDPNTRTSQERGLL